MAQFNLSITLEYDVITHNDLGQLITEVNERLQSGKSWQPLGGIVVSENDDSWAGRIFYQAIVREKPKVYKHDFELGWQLDTPSP